MQNKKELDRLITFLEKLTTEENGKYTDEEKQRLTEAIVYLKQIKENKGQNLLIKGVLSFIRAYVLHEFLDDD